MTTLLYSHPASLEHDPGPGHPEKPARLEAVLAALEAPDFAALERRQAPPADQAQIARVHRPAYIEAVFDSIPETGYHGLDGDTVVSPGSGEAARRAAGALCAAVDAVAVGEARNAFCAHRPPGHHAEPAKAMGFCLFNSVAIGALQAREVRSLRRVAVVDFDVHHGNGTQAMFWDDPELFYGSVHQMPLYPGTGREDERGVAGNIVNAPLAPMSGSTEFRRAWGETLLPKLHDFAPDFILVSAGFDAHEDDPLANLRLSTEDFAWATRELLALARTHCDGRLVSTLEGGYDLNALAAAAAAHVRALMAA